MFTQDEIEHLKAILAGRLVRLNSSKKWYDDHLKGLHRPSLIKRPIEDKDKTKKEHDDIKTKIEKTKNLLTKIDKEYLTAVERIL
jgi:hypothetical protein